MNDSEFSQSFDERTSFHFSTAVKWSESTLLHACFSNFCERIDSMITPTLYKDCEFRKMCSENYLDEVILLHCNNPSVQNPKLNINWHQIDSRFCSSWLEKEMNSIINPFWSGINTRDHHTTTEHTGWWLTGQHLRIEPICSKYRVIFMNMMWLKKQNTWSHLRRRFSVGWKNLFLDWRRFGCIEWPHLKRAAANSFRIEGSFELLRFPYM